MNAAIFTKSATGLILASGLIAASSVMVSAQQVTGLSQGGPIYAQEATLSLGASATMPLINAYQNPPSGLVSLGGHKFDLTGGNAVTLADGKGASVTASLKGARAAYLLLNTYNSYLQYSGLSAGRLTLTFSDGTTQATDLKVGGNVREWRIAGADTVDSTTDQATTNAWSGTANPAAGGGSAVMDMLTVNVSATGKTLTGVALQSSGLTNGSTPLGLVFSAVTIGYEASNVGSSDDNKDNNNNNDDNNNDNKDVNRVNPPTIKPGKPAPEKAAEKDGNELATAPRPVDPKHTVRHQTDHESPGAAENKSDD